MAKYNTLIESNEFYSLLLQIKSKIRKELKNQIKLENSIFLITSNIVCAMFNPHH